MAQQQSQPPHQTTPLSPSPSPNPKGKWILITGVAGVVALLAIFVYGMSVLGHNLFKPKPTPVSLAGSGSGPRAAGTNFVTPSQPRDATGSNSSPKSNGETEQGADLAKSSPASGLNSKPLATKPPAAVKPKDSQPAPITSPPPPNDGGNAPETPSSPQPEPAQPPAAPSEAQFNDASEALVKLHARMDAANQSLTTMKQEMAAQGLTLRGDIAAAEDRMQSYFQMADRAFQNRDIESAQKNIDRTERELTKIEHFLGR